MMKGVHPLPGLHGEGHLVHLSLPLHPEMTRLWAVLLANAHLGTNSMMLGGVHAPLLLLQTLLLDCLVLRAPVHWRLQLGHAEYAASLEHALSSLHIQNNRLA